MSKILLAIDNENIFGYITQNTKYDFFEKDIVYKEGVIEVLENNPEIDFLIINSNICGEINIEDFIVEINEIRENIKIIIFVDSKNEDRINFFNSKGIYHIYRLEELTIRSVNEIIENAFFESTKINSEINSLKNLLEGNKLSKFQVSTKVIIFLGADNIGKTIFSTTIAQIVEKQKKKVIIISFDIIKYDISILFNCEKIINQKQRVSTFIDIIYLTEMNTSLIESLKNEYDYIIIDSSENYEFIKYIFINDMKKVFIVEPTILGINKANILLEKFLYEYEINTDEIEIIFNRFDRNSISKMILNEIFKKYYIIGFCKNGNIKRFIKRKLIKEGRII